MKYCRLSLKFVMMTLAVPPFCQFLSLMETIDRQRDEMGRSSRSVQVLLCTSTGTCSTSFFYCILLILYPWPHGDDLISSFLFDQVHLYSDKPTPGSSEWEEVSCQLSDCQVSISFPLMLYSLYEEQTVCMWYSVVHTVCDIQYSTSNVTWLSPIFWTGIWFLKF